MSHTFGPRSFFDCFMHHILFLFEECLGSGARNKLCVSISTRCSKKNSKSMSSLIRSVFVSGRYHSCLHNEARPLGPPQCHHEEVLSLLYVPFPQGDGLGNSSPLPQHSGTEYRFGPDHRIDLEATETIQDPYNWRLGIYSP